MKRVKQKFQSNSENKKEQKKYRDIKRAAKEFYSQMCSGSTKIGSLMFNNTLEEKKVIEQICRYFDFKLVKEREILCSYPDCTNKFYVTHYYIEDI